MSPKVRNLRKALLFCCLIEGSENTLVQPFVLDSNMGKENPQCAQFLMTDQTRCSVTVTHGCCCHFPCEIIVVLLNIIFVVEIREMLNLGDENGHMLHWKCLSVAFLVARDSRGGQAIFSSEMYPCCFAKCCNKTQLCTISLHSWHFTRVAFLLTFRLSFPPVLSVYFFKIVLLQVLFDDMRLNGNLGIESFFACSAHVSIVSGYVPSLELGLAVIGI